MRAVLSTLYIMVCCFVYMFLLSIAAYYGSQAPTLSQSHMTLLPYLVIVSAVLTVFISTIVAVGFGMYYLYQLIFRKE